MAAGATVVAMARFKMLAEPAAYQSGCTYVMLAAGALAVFLACYGFWGTRTVAIFGGLALALLASSVFAVYASHNKFPHYLELMVIPLSTLIGWLLMRQGARLSTAVLALAIIVWGEMALWKHVYVNMWAPHEKMAMPEGSFIDGLTRPGSSIVVWGWRPEIYLSAGRILRQHGRRTCSTAGRAPAPVRRPLSGRCEA